MLHFDRYARGVLIRTSRNQVLSAFAESGLDEKDKELMADTFAQINLAYFAGDPIDEDALDDGLELWRQQPASFFSLYIDTILADEGNGCHSIHYAR